MVPQAYKCVNTDNYEIYGWKVLSRPLHERAPNIVWMNSDVQYDLSTLIFKNWEQLEDFHIIIIILQQEINLSGESVYPTRLIFRCMKSLAKCDKLKEFLVPKMTDLIILRCNNGQLDIYTEGNIHGLYCYLEIIRSPTYLNSSVNSSNHVGNSFFTNNGTATLHIVISALHIIKKGICVYYGIIGHKSNDWIIFEHKLLPTSLRININQLNTVHGNKKTDPPREWNR